MIKIGVTGTRNGMSDAQSQSLDDFISWQTALSMLSKQPINSNEIEVLHGDCIGVDAEIATWGKQLGYKIVCYPPIKDDLRAFVESDVTLEPKSYFARNRDIVDDCDILLVFPKENEHQDRGGTWYTYDYAMKKGKEVVVFYPNGNTVEHNT